MKLMPYNNIIEIKTFNRDLNLEILTNIYNIDIDSSKIFNDKIRWFMPNRKLIDYSIKSGAVLTGSRALRCIKVNGKFILERRCKDWDFIVTPKIAFNIFNQFNINEIPDIGKVISIKRQRIWIHPAYSDSYRVGTVDVQFLIKEELPDYELVNGIRFSKIEYILNEKVKLIDDLLTKSDLESELNKNIEDMKECIIKFNYIKNLSNIQVQ